LSMSYVASTRPSMAQARPIAIANTVLRLTTPWPPLPNILKTGSVLIILDEGERFKTDQDKFSSGSGSGSDGLITINATHHRDCTAMNVKTIVSCALNRMIHFPRPSCCRRLRGRRSRGEAAKEAGAGAGSMRAGDAQLGSI